VLNEERLKITTLVENTAFKRGFLAEWGLCVLIEADGKKILLDSGASPHAVLHNARVLGTDLSEVDVMVLSHGHFDHTGGLTAVLGAMGREMEIIAHPSAWDLKYARRNDPEWYEYCGIPFSRDELERLGARFTFTAGPTWITGDVVVSGEEPMTTDFEAPDAILCLKQGESYVRDTVADDQSIYIKTNLGLVVVAGCAHRGIINVVRHARELTGMDSVYLVLGGTHLFTAPDAQLEKTIEAFRELRVEWIGVSHCTGMKQSARLAREFGDRFFFNNTGTVIRFPLEVL
jgi:7,8-dihydropterin-6-yl-methyl-4-(beta-D-ribofuranosyl)aminobenzene 5'-phosphate synthase